MSVGPVTCDPPRSAGFLLGARVIATNSFPGRAKEFVQQESQNGEWAPLLERVLKRDEAAECELVERLWPRVAGRVAGLCPRRDEVEDLTQVIFVKVFQKLRQYRGGTFEAWVDILARRVCYDALRKQRVRPEWRFADLEDFDEGRIVDREAAEGFGDNAREIIGALFRRMAPQHVWLLNEVELKERTISEVSKEMGWTNLAGRLRLMRARRLLEAEYHKLVGGNLE